MHLSVSLACSLPCCLNIAVDFQLFFPCTVQFSSSHGLQHARLPCPSPTPGVYSNSVPLSRWYHPTISSSFVPLSSRLQSFPTSGSFQMSQLFASGGQSIGAFSFSISPSNEHPGLTSFRMMDWLDLLAIQGTLKSLQHHSSKAFSFLYGPTHILTWWLDPCVERNSQPSSGHLRAPRFLSTATPSLLVDLPSTSFTFFYCPPSEASWSSLMSTDLTASLQQLHVLEILLIHISC